MTERRPKALAVGLRLVHYGHGLVSMEGQAS